MINNDQKSKLIESLLEMFHYASDEAAKMHAAVSREVIDGNDISPEAKEVLDKYRATRLATQAPKSEQLMPQVCALLLSTGQIVAGVAIDPISPENLDAEDAVQIAGAALNNHPALLPDFKIVAVAMTTATAPNNPVEIDLELHEQSLSELPNLNAKAILLIDPATSRISYSAPFSDYRIM